MNRITYLDTSKLNIERAPIKKRNVSMSLEGWSPPEGEVIPILVPLKDGHELSMNVLKGITLQTVPTCLITISRLPKNDPRYPLDSGFAAQSECRNLLLSVILNENKWKNTQYAMMMNRDIILKPTAIYDLIKSLEEDKECSAVSLYSRACTIDEIPTKLDLVHCMHVDIACVLFNRRAMEVIKFSNARGCNCSDVWDCLAKNNMKIKQLETYSQFEEVYVT
jgi:hypothetical protein